jgi:hypothetical protein
MEVCLVVRLSCTWHVGLAEKYLGGWYVVVVAILRACSMPVVDILQLWVAEGVEGGLQGGKGCGVAALVGVQLARQGLVGLQERSGHLLS